MIASTATYAPSCAQDAARGSSKADPSRSQGGRWGMLFSGGMPAAPSESSLPYSPGRSTASQESMLLTGHPGAVPEVQQPWLVTQPLTPALPATNPSNPSKGPWAARAVWALRCMSPCRWHSPRQQHARSRPCMSPVLVHEVHSLPCLTHVSCSQGCYCCMQGVSTQSLPHPRTDGRTS